MKHFLIVVDMQKDFVDGALGTPEAQAIVDNVVRKIREFEGTVFVTFDTHDEEYLHTAEGRRLPVLTEEKLDESVIRLISAALICERNRLP